MKAKDELDNESAWSGSVSSTQDATAPIQVLLQDHAEIIEASSRRTIGAAIDAMAAYAARYVDENTILIALGDHQPAPLITGDDASEITRFNFFEAWPCRWSLLTLDGEPVVLGNCGPDRASIDADTCHLRGLVDGEGEAVLVIGARIVAATCPGAEGAPAIVGESVEHGAGVRALQAIVLAAKVHALRAGRLHLADDDVDADADDDDDADDVDVDDD